MKFLLLVSLFILSGCGNISDNNFESKIKPEEYLLTTNDFNDTFKVFDDPDTDNNSDIINTQSNDGSKGVSNKIIDEAIKKLAICANNEVLFYSDAKPEYEGETLLGELFGGIDKVYVEINSFVYVKRGIEGEYDKFTKYRNCYGDYITARFKASLDENISVSDYSSEVIEKDKIRVIHYRFDVSSGEKIFAITNSLFISKEYSLISVAEVISIGGDATDDEYNNIINKILN